MTVNISYGLYSYLSAIGGLIRLPSIREFAVFHLPQAAVFTVFESYGGNAFVKYLFTTSDPDHYRRRRGGLCYW